MGKLGSIVVNKNQYTLLNLIFLPFNRFPTSFRSYFKLTLSLLLFIFFAILFDLKSIVINYISIDDFNEVFVNH